MGCTCARLLAGIMVAMFLMPVQAQAQGASRPDQTWVYACSTDSANRDTVRSGTGRLVVDNAVTLTIEHDGGTGSYLARGTWIYKVGEFVGPFQFDGTYHPKTGDVQAMTRNGGGSLFVDGDPMPDHKGFFMVLWKPRSDLPQLHVTCRLTRTTTRPASSPATAATQSCDPDVNPAAAATVRQWQSALDAYERSEWAASIRLFNAVQQFFGRCADNDAPNSARQYNHLAWKARALYYAGAAEANLGNAEERANFYLLARPPLAAITAAKDVAQNSDIDLAHNFLLRMGSSPRAMDALKDGLGEMSGDPSLAERLLSDAYTNGYDDGDLGAMLRSASALGVLGTRDGMGHSLWLADQALGNVVPLAHARRDCQALLATQAVASANSNRIRQDDSALAKYRNSLRALARKAGELRGDLVADNKCAPEDKALAQYVPADLLKPSTATTTRAPAPATTLTVQFWSYKNNAKFPAVRGRKYLIEVSGLITYEYGSRSEFTQVDAVCGTEQGRFHKGHDWGLRINDKESAADYTPEPCQQSHEYSFEYTANADVIEFNFRNWNTRSSNQSGLLTVRVSPRP